MDEIEILAEAGGGEGGGPLTAEDVLPMVARVEAPDALAEELTVLAHDPVRTFKITPFKGDAMHYAKGAADRYDCARLRASAEEDSVAPQYHVPDFDHPNWNWYCELPIEGSDGTFTHEMTNEIYIQCRASEVAAL